ncbi:unnamed protein product [Acanthoscelides obtectus]|uniref:Succinate dehydrogenase assembly factor 2, mitochondrial n=1 Tax=Acanthoscelides obtectus TaxID=200917 RepID=A0A9P0JTF9_ACAOB|nr:unnamed protein product [Acanthoscelides obtectus]CAK1668005.1 Succinate dehydrogenase assembly factor 2-A, mitochondrial [Acanthoscelides obtectus]
MNAVQIACRRVFGTSSQSPVQRVINSRAYSNVIDPPDDGIVEIPKPKSRENEPMKQRKARLLYQSRKRGMLENDLLLSTFVHKHLDLFSETQVELYDSLINGPSNDWDIYYWATNIKPTPKQYDHEVMDLLKIHCKNLNKELRIRQPDL